MNNSKIKLIAVLTVTSIMLTCSASSRVVFKGEGLVTGEPGMNSYPEEEPGETALIERAYEIAPPSVPHAISDFTIDRTTNDCLECHLDGEEFDEDHIATKIPPSHFTNEYKQESVEESVTGIRYNCTQCHVQQAIVDFKFWNGSL
ncbi:MAG: nitrate reductase cytochrome c-type subunit [Candidatus Marinimicrobia bacterium]|nr:nitrate reductase cytochrome c-type subunit [Candidatus Neomarinimicrobiota bacterium]